MDAYISALCVEIDERGRQYSDSEIETLFIGGGTPTLLTPAQLEKIIIALSKRFKLSKNMEFSIEANPETVDDARLAGYRSIGVNRISIGVQSFNDAELAYLGRIHSADKARLAIKTAQKYFDNISLDLISTLPGQSLTMMQKNLEEAVSFEPKHLSCYELTFEKGTKLDADKDKASENDVEIFQMTREFLVSHGYMHYEISNYALPDFECRHNLAYWSDESYLGLGVAAHSYDREQNMRRGNTENILDYRAGRYLAFEEPAKDIDKILMGLRKTEGMPISQFPAQFLNKVTELIADGKLIKKDSHISFTDKGLLIANRVLLELIQ